MSVTANIRPSEHVEPARCVSSCLRLLSFLVVMLLLPLLLLLLLPAIILVEPQPAFTGAAIANTASQLQLKQTNYTSNNNNNPGLCCWRHHRRRCRLCSGRRRRLLLPTNWRAGSGGQGESVKR